MDKVFVALNTSLALTKLQHIRPVLRSGFNCNSLNEILKRALQKKGIQLFVHWNAILKFCLFTNVLISLCKLTCSLIVRKELDFTVQNYFQRWIANFGTIFEQLLLLYEVIFDMRDYYCWCFIVRVYQKLYLIELYCPWFPGTLSN